MLWELLLPFGLTAEVGSFADGAVLPILLLGIGHLVKINSSHLFRIVLGLWKRFPAVPTFLATPVLPWSSPVRVRWTFAQIFLWH